MCEVCEVCVCVYVCVCAMCARLRARARSRPPTGHRALSHLHRPLFSILFRVYWSTVTICESCFSGTFTPQSAV
jgi:hypothetical protein